MLKRIETSEVWRRATQAFDEHNEKCDIGTFIRQTAQGPVEYHRRLGIIPEAITTTFHTILTEYIHNYNRMCQMMPLSLQDPANPPALPTNNVRIAKYARCTDRTVRNHMSRLKDLGFVTTKFHGSKHNFELWINTDLLFGPTSPESAENALETALPASQHKIFPHNSTHRETFEKEKRNADMLIVHGENNQGQRGKTESESPALADGDVSRRDERLGGGPRLHSAEIVAQNDQKRRERVQVWYGKQQPKAPNHLSPFFVEMLFNFWFYAWKVIYPARDFTKQQKEKALAAISEGVFANFEGNWSQEEWNNYYQIQLAKVDKAGRYYDNHPDAYKPDPYSVHITGKGYFDADNAKGFIGIDAWLKKDAIKRAWNRRAYAEKEEAKAKRAETLLLTARRDFEKLRMNTKPRKEVANLNQISLFQYYNTIFGSLGKKWVAAFCQQFMEQKQRDFQPPAYYKPRKIRALAGEKVTIVEVEPWMHDAEGDREGYYVD